MKDLIYLTQKIQKLKEAYANEVRKEINGIFAMYPNVGGIIIRHWTPYFNDGEACVYGTHGIDVYPKDLTLLTSEDFQPTPETTIEEIMEENGSPYCIEELLYNNEKLGPEFNEIEQWVRNFWGPEMLMITQEEGITHIKPGSWTTEYYEHD